MQPIDVAMKFGGSSLADEHRIDHVANLIKSQRAAGFRPRAVVCSAMGKTTNALLSAGEFALGKSYLIVMDFRHDFQTEKICSPWINCFHRGTSLH